MIFFILAFLAHIKIKDANEADKLSSYLINYAKLELIIEFAVLIYAIVISNFKGGV